MKRLLAGVTSTLLVVGASALPASAEPGTERVALSIDRTTWGTHLTEPLFDETIRWVPGDTRTATFWVSNRASDDGRLTVTAVRAAGDHAVTVRLRVAGGEWVRLGDAVSVRGGTLEPGATRRVDVQVSFDRAAGNETQDRAFPATFRATLVQDTAATGGDTGSLAGTGADVDPRLLLAALGALGAGGVLLIAGRRRNEQKEDS